jgi:acyl-[acyl-carrier-protein] desaturase
VGAAAGYGGVTTPGPPARHEEDTVASTFTQRQLLEELEPVVAKEIDRHHAVAKEWMPHEFIPWSQGRDFDGPLGGEAWEPGQSRVSETARTALVVNLLTEDNLPSYHREIYQSFGPDGAWGTWIGRWTAEEGRHGIAIRDYLLATRAVDPVALERERMVHMTQGFSSSYELDMLHTVAYVSFQELATRISHRNTGKYTEDPLCEQLLQRISVDENLPHDLLPEPARPGPRGRPDQTVQAIWDVVEGFEMPGSTIEGFTRRSLAIALAGIYDLRIHRDEVLAPVLRAWKVFDLEGLSPEAEQAREKLAAFMDELERKASRFEDKRAAQQARHAARDAARA